MASDRGYLEFILEQISPVEGVSFRAMMGEYILYCGGRIFGGIYDARLLVKATDAAKRMMPDAPMEAPYEGAGKMILVEDVDDRDFLCGLLRAMLPELPEPKKKKRSASDFPGPEA